jgi:hypothetical protein
VANRDRRGLDATPRPADEARVVPEYRRAADASAFRVFIAFTAFPPVPSPAIAARLRSCCTLLAQRDVNVLVIRRRSAVVQILRPES